MVKMPNQTSGAWYRLNLRPAHRFVRCLADKYTTGFLEKFLLENSTEIS
jgi:hypothetical protein